MACTPRRSHAVFLCAWPADFDAYHTCSKPTLPLWEMLHQPGYVVDGELLLTVTVTAVPTQPGCDSCQCDDGDAQGDGPPGEFSALSREPAVVRPPSPLEHDVAAPAAPPPTPPTELQLEQATAAADAAADAAATAAATAAVVGSPPPKRACSPAAAVGPLGSHPRLLSTLYLRCASMLPTMVPLRPRRGSGPGSTRGRVRPT